jgi:hypothetical protein
MLVYSFNNEGSVKQFPYSYNYPSANGIFTYSSLVFFFVDEQNFSDIFCVK